MTGKEYIGVIIIILHLPGPNFNLIALCHTGHYPTAQPHLGGWPSALELSTCSVIDRHDLKITVF